MAGMLFNFIVIIFAGAAGVAVGWWVRSGRWKPEKGDPDKTQPSTRRAREALTRLQDLAVHVATEVGEHSTRVQEINEELATGGGEEAESVLEAVAKIIDANKRMQQELQAAEQRLQEQARVLESRMAEALTDALTKLANRRAFDEEMTRRQSEFQRHGRNVCVIMLDIDHFKRVNDTHGHRAGDEVLRGVARMLRRTFRDMDIPCRYGGEEFAVILPGTTLKEACIAAERARQSIAKEVFYFEGTGLHVATSVGLAELLPGESVDTVVQRADEALYASKEAGRNCCHRHDGQICHLIGSPPMTEPAPTRSERGDEPDGFPLPPADALAKI
jgi:diguanylate cyclase